MTVRIGKVKYKNGTELTILPPSKRKTWDVPLGNWGNVRCEIFEDDEQKTPEIERRDALYMLEAAKISLITK